jgi:hypothetical protein
MKEDEVGMVKMRNEKKKLQWKNLKRDLSVNGR